MLLYKIIDGAYLGFYQEYGGTVFISGYRTIVKKQWIFRVRPEEVWVDGDWLMSEIWIPGHYEARRFWVWEDWVNSMPAYWGVRQVWVKGYWQQTKTWEPGRYELFEIDSWGWDDVEFEDPIYSYYGSRDEYCLVARLRAPPVQDIGKHEGDLLSLRITGTDEWIHVEADYICCATSIGENEYVEPSK